jgi:hypothetical protein
MAGTGRFFRSSRAEHRPACSTQLGTTPQTRVPDRHHVMSALRRHPEHHNSRICSTRRSHALPCAPSLPRARPTQRHVRQNTQLLSAVCQLSATPHRVASQRPKRYFPRSANRSVIRPIRGIVFASVLILLLIPALVVIGEDLTPRSRVPVPDQSHASA